MEKLPRKIDQNFDKENNFPKLEQGDSIVLFDSKTGKTAIAGRSNPQNFQKDIHEAFKKAGIE